MPFVDKKASNRARPRVQIFVCAPYGEIDIPFVQLQRDISGCVCKVPANCDTSGMCVFCYCSDVEKLAGIKLNTREENQSDLVCIIINGLANLCTRQSLDCRGWIYQYHSVLRRIPMILDLGFHGELVTLLSAESSNLHHRWAMQSQPSHQHNATESNYQTSEGKCDKLVEKNHTYIIRRKSFALKDDLITLLCRAIEAAHHQV